MDTDALKYSWEQVAKSGDEVPLYFYSHIVPVPSRTAGHVPGSRWRSSATGWSERSARSSAGSTSSTRSPPSSTSLGRDHRRFSVVPEHYNAVGASLLATLKQFLGAAWTEELAQDWAAAYGVIARVMVEAAEESSDTSPAWWDAEVVSTERRTMDVSVVQIRPGEPHDYAPGQSFAMEIPQRPRLWRYFSPANAPREDGSLELHVQLVDGGQVSSALTRSLRPGDTVKLGAPVGDQLTRASGDQRDLLLVGGGTGLAPLRSVMEQVDREWQDQGSGPRVHSSTGPGCPGISTTENCSRTSPGLDPGSSTPKSSPMTVPTPVPGGWWGP